MQWILILPLLLAERDGHLPGGLDGLWYNPIAAIRGIQIGPH
jgi:hypothetical protein